MTMLAALLVMVTTAQLPATSASARALLKQVRMTPDRYCPQQLAGQLNLVHRLLSSLLPPCSLTHFDWRMH